MAYAQEQTWALEDEATYEIVLGSRQSGLELEELASTLRCETENTPLQASCGESSELVYIFLAWFF